MLDCRNAYYPSVGQFLQQFAIRIFIENGVFSTLCAKADPEITAEQLSRYTNENKLLIGKFLSTYVMHYSSFVSFPRTT